MLTPDWYDTNLAEYLEEKIGNGFKVREGWTITNTDTILCTKYNETLWRVDVWNDPKAYDKIKELFDLKVYIDVTVK